MTMIKGKMSREQKKLALLRSFKTRTSSKFTASGQERRQKPKPVTVSRPGGKS